MHFCVESVRGLCSSEEEVVGGRRGYVIFQEYLDNNFQVWTPDLHHQ